jgi:hypothetical protein
MFNIFTNFLPPTTLRTYHDPHTTISCCAVDPCPPPLTMLILNNHPCGGVHPPGIVCPTVPNHIAHLVVIVVIVVVVIVIGGGSSGSGGSGGGRGGICTAVHNNIEPQQMPQSSPRCPRILQQEQRLQWQQQRQQWRRRRRWRKQWRQPQCNNDGGNSNQPSQGTVLHNLHPVGRGGAPLLGHCQ